MRPLDGCLVLDFSTLLPGPLATLILAEAGAEVVKVERPGGDEMRAWTPKWGRQSLNFALLNRGNAHKGKGENYSALADFVRVIYHSIKR